MLYEGCMNSTTVFVIVDSGVSQVSMSLDTAWQCGLEREDGISELNLDDSSSNTTQGTVTAKLKLSASSSTERIYVQQEPDKHATSTAIVTRE